MTVRHGYLVYEKYFGKGNREAHPDMASFGKAFTSISCGILLTMISGMRGEGGNPGMDRGEHRKLEAVARPAERPGQDTAALRTAMCGWQLGGIFSAQCRATHRGTRWHSVRANVIGTPNDPHEIGLTQPHLDAKAYAVPRPRTFGN